jgi:hypothetical protein
MTRPRGLRYTTLALVMLGLACGDEPTAPDARQETVLVSLVGIAPDDAGVVLQLTGDADQIESASGSLEVAWVRDATNTATVAIVGPLSASGDVLLVKRQAGLEPLRAEVREVAGADGAVSSPASARAIVRATQRP